MEIGFLDVSRERVSSKSRRTATNISQGINKVMKEVRFLKG